jgi:hypothetical protein
MHPVTEQKEGGAAGRKNDRLAGVVRLMRAQALSVNYADRIFFSARAGKALSLAADRR